MGVCGSMMQVLTAMIQGHGGSLDLRKPRKEVGAMIEARRLAVKCIQNAVNPQRQLFNWCHLISMPMAVEVCGMTQSLC